MEEVNQCIWEDRDQLETEGARRPRVCSQGLFQIHLGLQFLLLWFLDYRLCHLVIVYRSFHHRGAYSLLS